MQKPQVILYLGLFAVILSAWGSLVFQYYSMSHSPMSEMWMPPSEALRWSVKDFSLVFVMWGTMMVAMMLPSLVPTLNVYALISEKHNQTSLKPSFLFILGYLIIWFMFSIALTIIQWQFHSLLWLSPMMANNNNVMAILVLTLAGLHQLSPTKNNCLKYCQSPVGFFLNNWQSGNRGALQLGLKHGKICLGCCWAEMLVMFAVGVMNIWGMIIITGLVALEKMSPLKPRTTSSIGAFIYFCWALLVIKHS